MVHNQDKTLGVFSSLKSDVRKCSCFPWWRQDKCLLLACCECKNVYVWVVLWCSWCDLRGVVWVVWCGVDFVVCVVWYFMNFVVCVVLLGVCFVVYCVVCVVWYFMNFEVYVVLLGVCFVVYCVVWCCVRDVLCGGRGTIARGRYCVGITPNLNLTLTQWKELSRKFNKKSQAISVYLILFFFINLLNNK